MTIGRVQEMSKRKMTSNSDSSSLCEKLPGPLRRKHRVGEILEGRIKTILPASMRSTLPGYTQPPDTIKCEKGRGNPMFSPFSDVSFSNFFS
jgi:hypothetical protein